MMQASQIEGYEGSRTHGAVKLEELYQRLLKDEAKGRWSGAVFDPGPANAEIMIVVHMGMFGKAPCDAKWVRRNDLLVFQPHGAPEQQTHDVAEAVQITERFLEEKLGPPA
jgi:hypothetical protein